MIEETTTGVIPEKRCMGPCGRYLPATDEFFHRKKNGLRPRCKKCRCEETSRRKKRLKNKNESKQPVESAVTPTNTLTQASDKLEKTCTGPCGRTLPHTSEYFYVYRDKRHQDQTRLNSKCKQCWNLGRPKEARRRPKAAKQSTIPLEDVSLTGLYDQCGACGTRRGNIRSDVNEVTGQRYGYLCTNCYRVVAESKGNIARMHNVVDYLEKTRHPSSNKKARHEARDGQPCDQDHGL